MFDSKDVAPFSLLTVLYIFNENDYEEDPLFS